MPGGWDEGRRGRLLDAYSRGLDDARPDGQAEPAALDLARCRLHLALQWLGWSSDWRPPREHAHDWLGEAAGLVKELGLE